MRVIIAAVAACSTAAAPVANHGVGAFAGCARASACIAACERRDAGACERASRFVVAELGYVHPDGPLPPNLPYERAACDAGSDEACMTAALLAYDRIDDTARTTCDRGVALACWQIGSLAKALALYRAACDRDDETGCLGVAELYGAFDNGRPVRPELPYEEAKVVEYLARSARIQERLCGDGDALACIDRAWLSDNKHAPVGPPPQRWVDRACALVGEPPTCWHGYKPPALQ